MSLPVNPIQILTFDSWLTLVRPGLDEEYLELHGKEDPEAHIKLTEGKMKFFKDKYEKEFYNKKNK